MVAIFTGLGAGFERGSGAALGARGLLGGAALGRGGEGVFLNAATGNLLLSRQDEFLIGKGPDASVTRTYNSQGALDDNGDHWRQSTDRRIYGLTGTVSTTGSTVKRVSADGSEITYTWNASGSYYQATDGAGSYDRLTYNGALWTWADGDTSFFETYALSSTGVWRIASQVDGDGNVLAFAYVVGSPDKLEKVTTQDGGFIKYTWTGSKITRVESWINSTTSYSNTVYGYDGSNRLTSVTVDLTPSNGSDSITYGTTYTYDGTSKRVASITQTDGSVLSISYYTAGAYTDWVKDLTQTVGSGDTRVTAFAYTDEGGGITRTDVTDPRGQVTKLWWKNADTGGTATDERGQFVRQMAPPAVTGGTPTEINYTYDANGNVLTAVTKSGTATLSTVSYQYDAAGNVSQITDANGNIATRQYAATTNKLLLETRTGSHAGGSGSLYTRYVYDAEEHLTFVISAEGHVTEYAYTSGGELQYVFEYPGDAYAIGSTLPTHSQMVTWRGGLNRTTSKILQNDYDTRGNLIATTRYGASDASGAALTAEGTSVVYYSYDAGGRLLSKYNSAGSSGVAETYAYDGLGRVTVSTDAAGGRTTVVFNDAATTTTVTTQTASNGTQTGQSYVVLSTYNKAGEVVSVVDSGSATNGTFTAGGTTASVYDKNGQLRLTTDPTGLRRFYLYDKAGRKIADVRADSSATATGEIVEYRYDASGRIVATARYTYRLTTAQLATLSNPANEVEISTIRPASHGYDIWEWNVYDPGGRVIETILGDGSVTGYEYDASDRLVKTTGFYNKLPAATVTGYMAASPTAVAWPTAHANDTVSRTFYDRDGRLVGALSAEGYLSKIVYDEAGQKIQEIVYANATTTTYRATGTYDQLLSTVTLDATRDISTRYVYDGQGLLRYTIDGINRVIETVYFTATASMAVGVVRKTVAYATALGAVANYTYATVKSAVAALGSAQNDRASWSVYNDRGQLKYAISQIRSDNVSGVYHPIGAVTRYDYDAAGLVTKTTQYAATIDMFGVTIDTPAALDTWAGSNGANARITRNYYAERGELRFTVDAEGYVNQYVYAANGLVRYDHRYSSAITVDDTSSISTVNSANKGTSVFTETRYDAAGRKAHYWDANGVRYHYAYHATGKQAWEIKAWGQGTDESRTEYRYDQAGRLVRVIEHTSEISNASNVGVSAVEVVSAQRLQSANASYSAVLTREGELRLYHNGEVVWSNGVREVVAGATYRLVAQTDGNLVVYREVSGQASVPIWHTVTHGSHSGSTFLILQDNGNLELHKGTPGSSAGLIWSSGTTGLTASAYAAPFPDTRYTYDGLGNVLTVTDAKYQTTTNTYDKVGRLLTTSKGGATSTYQYDAFGRGVKVTDALGNVSYSYYDQIGRVVLTVDAESYAIRTTYNAFGEVAMVTRYANKATGTGSVTTQPTITANAAADAVTTFAYDKLGRLASKTDAAGGVESYTYDLFGRVATSTNKLGGVTTNIYDKLGRLIQEQLPVSSYNADGSLQAANVINKYAYDSRGNRTQITAAFGLTEARTTNYEYDAGNRLVRTYHDAVSVTTSAGTTSTITPEERFVYDRRSNVIETINATGARTLFWYDKLDRITHTLSATGTLSRSFYDLNGNLAETRVYETAIALPADAKGLAPAGAGAYRLTKYAYDALDRLTETRIPSIDVASISGGVLSVTAQDLVTTNVYDGVGNVVKVIDAAGKASWFYYDKAGNQTTVINAEDVRTDRTYDADGNILTEKRYYNASATPTVTTAPPAAPTAHAKDQTTTFVYDKAGRQTLTVDGEGYAVATAYNGLNQIVTVTRYASPVTWSGSVPVVVSGSGDAVTSMTYDLGGRLTNSADALNLSETYKLNGHGEQVRATNRLGGSTTYAYDKLGRMIAETLPVGAYNSAGTLIAANVVNTYEYDAVGNRTRMVEASGLAEARTTNFQYDGVGQLLRTYGVSTAVYASSTATSSTSVTPEDGSVYNAHGEVIETIDAAGARKLFWYNPAGRLTHQLNATGTVLSPTGTLLSMTGTLSRFFYDKNGNALETRVYETPVALPSNANGTPPAGTGDYRVTRYVYDNLNRAIETRVPSIETAVYSGGTLTVAPQDLVNTTVYDTTGNVVKTIDANGKATWFYYDKAGRQTTKIDGENYRTDWTYDADGNVLTERRYATASATPANITTPPSAPSTTTDDRVTKFTYDKLGQRLTETRLGVKVHDGSGGEILQSSTITYTYNALGQVLTKSEAASLPQFVTWFTNGTNVPMQQTYGQSEADQNTLFLRRDVPLTDPSWTWGQHGGTVLLNGGERPDGYYAIQGGQTVRYSFETAKTSASAMRTDALLAYWDASGNYLGSGGATYTNNTTEFTAVSSSTVAPANAAYVTLEIGLVRLNTTDSSPMEIAIRNFLFDNSGVTSSDTTLGRTSGDSVKYVYDAGGRLITEIRSGFIDVNNQWVTPTVDYYYNGLDDLSRTRQRGAGGAIAAADRVTTYAYGVGGRLASMTDPNGFTRTYRYNAAGRVVREEYLRDPASGTEGIGYDYDIAGRVIEQGAMNTPGPTWSKAGLDTVFTQYNAFGEVSARGLNGVLAEKFAYDGAGRLWRTTAGDGTWKYFMYDRVGNQTLAIASDGTDISNQSLSWVLERWGSNRAQIATTYVDGVVATITRHDGRNMAIEVLEPQRQLNATTLQNLQTQRAYNAFGEVAHEINAAGARIDYAYNTMGRLIRTESPTVSVTSETGAVSNVRPTEYRYYDPAGRLVASRDANGNLTRLELLAGTGHGGSEAQIRRTITADGAATTNRYTVHGDQRATVDQIGRQTWKEYDNMGRLVQMHSPGGLTENFSYDGLGQRISRWNSLLGYGQAEQITYDAQGRVIQQVAAGGDTTSFSYIWSGTLGAWGLEAAGGWNQVTTYANGKTLTEQSDQFGRRISKIDLGGHGSSPSYDKAGRLVAQTGGDELFYFYLNTGRVESMYTVTSSVLRVSSYTYDAVGNVLSESLTSGGAYLQNATATYNALGWLTTWQEAGTAVAPAASVQLAYDANGNIRRSTQTGTTLNAQGGTSTSINDLEYWYRFDALNRVVTNKGDLEGGQIVRGYFGEDIAYDLAGQRAYSMRSFDDVWVPPRGGDEVPFLNARRENYTYDAAGRLDEVRTTVGSRVPNGTVYLPVSGGDLIAEFEYDAMGRQLVQKEYLDNGSVAFHRTTQFNVKGQITGDQTSTRRGSVTYQAQSTFTYDQGSSATYALGSPLTITTTNQRDAVSQPTTLTTNTYAWYDGAVQNTITFKPDINQSPSNTTTHTYVRIGGAAQLTSAYINDGRPRTVTWTNDLSGRVIRRDEADGNTGTGDPHEIWYRFAGREMAFIGNNGSNDKFNFDYRRSITDRTATQGTGPFLNGSSTHYVDIDFNQGVRPLNSYQPGSGSGGYTVRGGETLSSIAANLWGDPSLWYKLAEANGLSGEAALVTGQTLRIPTGVAKNAHNAATFTPYDPTEAVGNTGPTQPKPQKNKCNALGAVILTVIAVVVVATLQPHLAAFFAGGQGTFTAAGAQVMNAAFGAGVTTSTATSVTAATISTGFTAVSAGAGFAAGAVAGAAASVATQFAGMAMGMQDKFSWNAVGIAAISGGIGGTGSKLGVGGTGPWSTGARAMIANAATQGLASLTGMQSKFSWAAVATAGVGAAVGNYVAGTAPGAVGYDKQGNLHTKPTLLNVTMSGGASAIANAAARSLIDGSDFGDNVVAALPDVIGGVIGQIMTGQVSLGREKPEAAPAASPPDPDETMAERPANVERLYTQEELAEAVGGGEIIPANGDGRDWEWWVKRNKALRDGSYSPETQLSDAEYDKYEYEVVRLDDGDFWKAGPRAVRLSFPDAGRDLEAFIRNFDPGFKSSYSELSANVERVEGRSDNSWGNMGYSEGKVTYLAEHAAALYDSMVANSAANGSQLIVKPPPLYSRTTVAATEFTFSIGGESMSFAIARGADRRVRATMTRGGGLPKGPIGRSGFANWGEVVDRFASEYQRATDAAWAEWTSKTPQQQRDSSRRHPNTQPGSFVDYYSQGALTQLAHSEGFAEGRREIIRVGRALLTTKADLLIRNGSSAFLADGSLSFKTLESNRGQMTRMMREAGVNSALIVRPSHMGSYTLLGPNYFAGQTSTVQVTLPPAILRRPPARVK